MTFKTVSALVDEFGSYHYLNMRWERTREDKTKESGIVTVYKVIKDGLWYYFLETTPNGFFGGKEYQLVMTSSMEIK